MPRPSDARDPAFWRAGALSITLVMVVVLVFLTIDSLAAIRAGGSHVPRYDVINDDIGYAYDAKLGYDVPVIGGKQPLFGREYTEEEAHALIAKGKLVIQGRACMDCHTFFGNGAYYAPDLTKAWLDPAWSRLWTSMTQQETREGAMVEFLMHPDRYPTWSREMPNLGIARDEAVALVAYLKWVSSVNANGFPANFGMIGTSGDTAQAAVSPQLGEEPHGAAPPATLPRAQLVAKGEKAYVASCSACHQANGLGVPGSFPPLSGGQPFAAPQALTGPLAERGFYKDGRIVEGPLARHIDIVLHGILGTAMPAFGAQLDDATVAAIVTFERNAFGNHTGDVVQAAAVRDARGAS
jgi:nitric oxide reductase subunit C